MENSCKVFDEFRRLGLVTFIIETSVTRYASPSQLHDSDRMLRCCTIGEQKQQRIQLFRTKKKTQPRVIRRLREDFPKHRDGHRHRTFEKRAAVLTQRPHRLSHGFVLPTVLDFLSTIVGLRVFIEGLSFSNSAVERLSLLFMQLLLHNGSIRMKTFTLQKQD